MNLTVLLQAKAEGNSLIMPAMMIGLVVIFYFFMIRPQQKKQKDQKKFRDALKKGDSVVTVGGIHGKIMSVEGETIVVDVDRGTKLTMEKSSVSMPNSK